ncbi:peptide chain release factor 1 [Kaistia algarum]|uniref:peptide chain release factor 1 n=1 Tax=Kaistia algarum TaxID=2083279 RepID=UPI000CE7A8F0|nr:peptide chain release factor 1 [Kaistia algarum]MCX5514497.1 peptide chain release factor 1 [Kaistia algarum]PPE79266.1 peptide chain release factor 1 [Kaistia algarum]
MLPAGLPWDKIEQLTARAEVIDQKLAATSDGEALVKLSKERAELQDVVEAANGLKALAAEREALAELAGDPDMADLAAEEKSRLDGEIEAAVREVRLLLLPKDAADEKSAILEIRAGTGGDEAALFAGDLLRMYQRYAAVHGWKMQVLSESEGDAGGFKEVIAEVSGRGVFARLKFESGVHRVQRVPDTEASGRIHTSAATVAVLPEAEDVDIDLKAEDVRIDTTRASSAGGQHANTTDTAVRITHVPSGTVIVVAGRSQHQNRAQAMTILRSRLFEDERARLDSARAADRRGQVGSGDRSERIRTYNFPQGRVTDHRINLTLYKLEPVIAGEALDEIIEPLITEHQAGLLAALDQ